MTDKYIFYEFDGERYKVPTDKQQDFESKAPNAKIMLTLDGENYKVPLTELNTFISKAGGANNLTYSSFDDKKQYSPSTSTEKLFSFEEPVAPVVAEEPKPIQATAPMVETPSEPADDDKVTWGETLKNSIGSLATRVGRKLWDSAVVNASRGVYIDPKTGEATRLDSVDEMIDNNHYAIEISKNMKEKADSLAKAADPTKGEQGYGELLKEGKLGTMVQKGLGDAIQSLDATAMGNNYLTMIPYVLASSSSNYIDQALENPDAPEWKRGAYALGTAAFEQFVEKFENPFAGKKVVGEITEKAAKEFIEKGTKEGVKAVADRIFNVLKRVGKGAGGEGLEEVVTSFGTDAIGEALDVIDGDKDYGIRAQWEQLKAQNPDASLKDYAKAKAGEYFDSFLGGAISGGWMSGPTQVAREAAESINDKVIKSRMQRTREMGSDLDLAHMYDVDDDVRSVTEEVANSFASEDGTQGISSEFIESLTAEDAYTLSRREDLPAAQRTALEHLAITKSMQEGLNDKLDQRLETEINANKALMEHVTEKGKIISGQLRGRLVYIMGGAINNGKVTIYSGHEGPVIAYDALTGEAETIGSKYITDAVSNDAADVISIMENSLRTMDANDRERWRTTMSPRAKTKAILPFAKKKILVDVGNGLTEVYVREIGSDGKVMIEGKKGDLGGQSILTLDATTFYDSIYRDNDGNPVVTEVEPQTEGTIENEPTEEPTEEPVAPTELTGEEDFRGYEGKIFIGGRLIDVIDAQQDNPSNTVNYTYLDENGNERVGTTTIGEFAAAIQQAQAQNVEPAPVVSPEPQPEPQPAPKDDVVATPIPTESIDWDALLDNDAEAYFNELQNRFGDKAERRLNAMITATENRLNKLNKENPQDPEEVFANDELKEKLENRLEVLRGLAARFTTTAEPTPVEPTTAEPTAVEPAPAVPVEAPVTEAPTEGKSENGFEFNEHNVCTNPEVISVPPVKKGWAVMNEVRLAEYNGKWGSAISAHTNMGGNSSPLTKSSCVYDTKEEAITNAYNNLVRFRDSRGKEDLKDVNNLIKHLEKEYPFVKESATPAPAPTTPAPAPTEPASAEPITTENGFIVIDKVITNPEVIEMPNTPKGDANRIFVGEYNGKWTYGAEALMDNGSWGMTPKMRIENARYDTREDAIKEAIGFLESQWKYRYKDAGSTALDSFIEYVRNTYLHNETPAQTTTTVEPEPEPATSPEPQPTPAPKPTATPKPKPIGQVEQQSGNAIKRLFKEFKANADKIAKKVGMKDFVGTDKTRPVMTGVHREGGFEYATDANILAKIQTKYPSEQEGKTFSLKTGEEISGKYPKVSDIVESHMKNARLVSANVDDILACSQLLEEIKKGLSNTNLYVKVGDKIFKSDILLKAAKMAKLHGLSDIYMRDDSRAPMIFVGSKGAVIAMPYQLNAGDQNVLDIDTGEIIFSDYTMLKSPTTLKGIEAAKLSLEAILPKIGNVFIDIAKNRGWLRLVDGKVKFDFPADEIFSAKRKAKDPNTYNALKAIEENGLEIPLSDEEIAKIFPELVNDSQGNSVPLGNEPTGENNGSKGEAPQGENTQGYPNDPNSRRGNNTGNQGTSQGGSQTTSGSGSDGQGGKEGQSVEDRYPARKGNATGKTLVDTFGFKNVAIPDSRKSILNSIYDFMMGMAKVLGISPKSIGNGGTLGLGNLRANSTSNARYQYRYYYSGEVYNAHMDFRYDRLMSVAHEWWHALDHVLMFFDSGKGLRYTTSVSESEFAGRKETYDAVNAVLKAIKDSGHPTRIRSLGYDYKYTNYLLKPTELVARAFDEYIKAKFEEAGIQIEGTDYEEAVRKPNAEEMAVIAPAIENLFKVLKEKEGKEAGTSVLYQIGEQMTPGSEAWRQATDTVLNALGKAGIEVVRVTEQQVADVVNNANENGAEILKTTDGVVYGWTDGQKIYLTEAGVNPNTPIHEYTHLWADAMMRKNPKGWNSIKTLLKGTPVWNAVVNDTNYSDIANNEDAVASEVLSRISGAENAQKLEQMAQEMIDNAKGTMRKAEARGIIQNIKDALNKFWNWVGKELFGIESFKSINEVTDRVLWDLMNQTDLGIPNAGEATQITNANGDVIADTNGKGRVRFSISTWRDGGRDYLVNWLANDSTLTEDEKADIVARMDEFYENAQKYTDVYAPFGSWSEAAVKYDENGNPLMSVIKANGDYAMNLDFSLVCKKRRPLNMLLRELINRNAFGTYSLRERELAEINWILQEYGFEVACALCFVDSKRYRVTGVADVFAQLYNKFVKALAPQGAQIAHFNYSNNPNVESVEGGLDTMSDEQLNWKKFDALAKKYKPTSVEGKVAKFLRENPSQRRLVDATDFIDANGFEAVKANNEALLSLYNSKKGSGGPKASFGDVQYLNDILKKEGAFDVDKAYAVGGVRLQSFSDFVPHMYFDYMQLFAELAAKKLPAHAYTKEVLFAKIFGLTGLKINMSLVPSVVEGGVAPGLDADGNYAWADAIKDKYGNIIQQAQSFPFDEAMAIQNAEGYSKNCGVIAVGISDEHIEKMLDDPNIPYIIPYHKSSLNAIVARMTNIDQYKDYTKVQNTKLSDGTNLPKGTPDFNFNEYLHTHKDATPQDAAQAYLDWCKEKGYLPKFRQFAYHPNYYKLLQDFNTMDTTTGEYAPQGAVSMTFPTEQNAFGNVETLIQQGLQEDADLEDKMNTDIKKAADAVEKRLAEIKKEPKLSEKKQKEQMAQLADERMARIKERAEADDDGILSRSGDITPEMDAAYMEAVERGDMETAQRMVDEAADKYLNEILLPDDSDEVGFKYHRGPAPTKTFKRYAVFNVKDGGFHAAYAGNATPTPVGVWLDAQNLQGYVSDKTTLDNGTPATYVKGDTGFDIKSKFSDEKAKEYGLKGTKMLLERGGKHSSDVPNFSQMNLGKDENGNPVKSREKDGALPHNKLIFEIEYGISDDGDLTEYVKENGRKIVGKNQGLAKIEPNQYYDFKTNPNAVGNWGIGGTFRITRLVPHSEVVSVTEQYKKDAIADANRMYENGEISKKDRDARVKSAEAIQVQKWVGGYNPADFGLSEDIVSQMAEEGSKMKLTDAVTYDDNGNVIPLSERFNPERADIRYRRSDIQNAAVDYNVGETRDGIIERAVSEEAHKLGVNVTFAKRSEMAKGHETDKGYYNTKTGEIVICPENNASIADAIQTILHEAVAHKGLRQLMGERFNEFISRVYDALDAKTKADVDKLAEDHYNGNTAVAMEEYMASLAEREDFNDNTIWDKIKNFFTDLINRILDRDDIVIGDNELRYILRASYNNMVNPRGMETVRGWAKDQTMREEYKINEATPELLSRTGIDPTEVSRETARSTYDRVVADSWQEFQRQFQDAMQPVRIAIDAIQQETGNIPIEDYENYILIQNHASSRSRVEIDEFVYKHYKPLIAKVNEVVSKIIESRGGNIKSEKERAYAYQELKVYLIAKHGLERNKYYQSTNTRKLNPYEKKKETEKVTKEFEEKVNNINLDDTLNDTEKELAIRNAEVELAAAITEINERMVPDLRDYSGLTSLFGYSPRKWEKAEEEAQLKAEEMEALIGEDVVNALWGKINAATNKTLRHSYESGLLSRQQYEDISKMFKFYIPLRGFDETTAEDVYSYARFEGNKFNPAVQTAKGRTSVADDPIAIIMNMAESEIAQGNKNRAKQALYNYLLNRSAGQSDQNSLMQIESVWYTIEVDESGKETYIIAAPNHESGETYEEFESRMLALEAENKAAKSKKGKVNIGKRFQKQMNRNSHYVYLKVNGVEKAIYINGNPKAADAINGTYMPKPSEFVNKWRDINRLISSTFTNYSLGFTARNFVRDALYSRINIAIKESDPEYRKKFRQNWWHAFGSMRKLIKAFRNGELDRPDLTEDEAMFVEFMRNGGQTGYTVINSVEAHKKDLEKAIKRMQKGIEHGGVKDTTAFKVLIGWIEVMNEASELLTRYTAYKTSRDLGRGIEKSVGDAKEISVNFNTRGAQDGTGGFGWIARYFGLTKYFFNASVQGVQNIGAMAQANKLKFCKVAGGIMAAGVVTPLVTGFIASIFGGDDDEEYWNIPEYDRQNNICIQMGGSYVKIPLPIGFRELYAIGDMVAAMAFDKKFDRDFVQVGTDMANKIASIVLPINPLESAANGLSLWDTMLYTAAPSVGQFAIQNLTNTDWKGAPLQKEYTYNEDDPQWMKAFNSNPKWMRCLSKWCNENINPDGDFDGWDWSPEKLDNTLSNLFGGVYTMIKQGGRTISTIISKDKDFRVASIPLVGVLLDTGINDDDRFVTDAYFDMKEYYDANVNSIKRTAKAFGYSLEEVFGDEPVGTHHPKMQKIYKNRNFDWMQEWYRGDKEIKSLSDKIKRREKKLAGMDEPSVELVEEITNLKNEYTTKRRDFVNDMLELD